MTGYRPFKELTAKFSRERHARVAARIGELKSEMALAELRQARERSQEELARTLKVKQPAVAKLEKRADAYVSYLRRYIEALGGSLEWRIARDHRHVTRRRVTITNFSDLGQAAAARRLDLDCMCRGYARGRFGGTTDLTCSRFSTCVVL